MKDKNSVQTARNIRPDKPRRETNLLIEETNTEALLLRTGVLHGHYCPGSALGVMASVYGLHSLARYRDIPLGKLLDSDGMEELLAVTETNSCFADGIQYVSGCTIGNNSLIYRDIGKTAVTFCDRSGYGIRLCVLPDYRAAIDRQVPAFSSLFEQVVKNRNHDADLVAAFKISAKDASFALAAADPGEVFQTAEVKIDIPSYAPIRESVVCTVCGESVMGGKTVEKDGKPLCVSCAGTRFQGFTGAGIVSVDRHTG